MPLPGLEPFEPRIMNLANRASELRQALMGLAVDFEDEGAAANDDDDHERATRLHNDINHAADIVEVAHRFLRRLAYREGDDG